MTTYADLGPPIPLEAPDSPPLTIDRLELLGAVNGLGEAIVLVDATAWAPAKRPIKLIVAARPHDGEILRVAVMQAPGAGFIAYDPTTVPGNLADIVRTMVLTDIS
jgi:hypothetical protein